jgi:hypothetical protein
VCVCVCVNRQNSLAPSLDLPYLVRIISIQKRYQLLQTHPSTHPATHLVCLSSMYIYLYVFKTCMYFFFLSSMYIYLYVFYMYYIHSLPRRGNLLRHVGLGLAEAAVCVCMCVCQEYTYICIDQPGQLAKISPLFSKVSILIQFRCISTIY